MAVANEGRTRPEGAANGASPVDSLWSAGPLHWPSDDPSASLISMFARVTSRLPGRRLDVARPARLHERLVVGNHNVAIHA
jgi:hypothetical protein